MVTTHHKSARKEENVYENYVRLRNQKGLTDYEVAKRAGFTTATLSNWKASRYTPKLDKIKAIADVLGVTVDELIKTQA